MMESFMNEPVEYDWTENDIVGEFEKCNDKKKVAKIYNVTVQQVTEILKGEKYKINMKCKKDCRKCSQLNVRIDDKGYPYGYDCLKYGDSVFEEQFTNEKSFDKDE